MNIKKLTFFPSNLSHHSCLDVPRVFQQLSYIRTFSTLLSICQMFHAPQPPMRTQAALRFQFYELDVSWWLSWRTRKSISSGNSKSFIASHCDRTWTLLNFHPPIVPFLSTIHHSIRLDVAVVMRFDGIIGRLKLVHSKLWSCFK